MNIGICRGGSMADKAWKQEERKVGLLVGSHRYPANSGRRVDCESERVVAQVKHVQRLSLAQLEALAVEIAALGEEQDKIDLLVVKRRAGRGKGTPGPVVLTEDAWRKLVGTLDVERPTYSRAKVRQSA